MLLRSLVNDPSLRLTEEGRYLLRLLMTHQIPERQGDRLAASVPPHAVVAVSEVARRCARSWEEFADRLSENLPAERLEQQGFLGAALFVHSLALEARLRAAAAEARAPLDFAAYTGESFGIITAAVAAGSLSVFDGAKPDRRRARPSRRGPRFPRSDRAGSDQGREPGPARRLRAAVRLDRGLPRPRPGGVRGPARHQPPRLRP